MGGGEGVGGWVGLNVLLLLVVEQVYSLTRRVDSLACYSITTPCHRPSPNIQSTSA